MKTIFGNGVIRSITLAAFCCVLSGAPALAQFKSFSFSSSFPPKVTTTAPPMKFPEPTPQPMPNPTPTPVVPVVPVMPQMPVQTGNYQMPNAIDLTHQIEVINEGPQGASALGGIKSLNSFPGHTGRDGADQITVRGIEGSKFTKPNSYTANFENGEIIASVHRPSRVGFVTFELGEVAMNDADVMLKRVDGVFHVVNLDGRGETVKIKLSPSEGVSQDAKVIALAPGYELVVGPRVLKRTDVRLADGYARRHFKVLDDGRVAVCEISTESILAASGVVASIKREDQSRKVIGDMSKMAAVLNYVNGSEGYRKEAPSTVAAR